ncbi:zinc-binding dehydrogenase (plasmid) [Rhizobium bangladeshense]|uniref:zinc-binding dehydrogenase n=1 Tax=Rhizobium bangladeshense TaxID=1138189 RepID=UPI001A990B3C|nr:zinc-binding dehydrogenase [Rhizobium bangladeshense]QSY97889.1 zinc-binding dehydrogenase [Rhizobium bangladeshense]
MRAVVIHEFGGPEVLRLEAVPAPEPAAGWVTIAVHAVSVNRTLDLAVRAGRYARPVQLPHVLGADPSGVVVAVGTGVTKRRVGDRVVTSPFLRPASGTQGPQLLGVQAWGGYAEFVTVPEDATYLIPSALDFPQATVVSRHAPMAFHLLDAKANLLADEWVLVMGAAGGLGGVGVQVAKMIGAKVIAGAGSDERVASAISLGADYGINYRSNDLEAEVMRITDGRGVDVVYENVSDPVLFPKALASLTRGGRLVTAGSHGGGTVPLDVSRLYMKQLTIMGSTGQTPSDTERSLTAAADGFIRADIHTTLPLEACSEAHRLLEAGEVSGKIVLTITHADKYHA